MQDALGYQAKRAIELIRDVGFARLALYDGCVCSDVKVCGFEIDIGCRKGSGGHIGRQIDPDFYGTIVRVSSGYLDIDDADCAAVAEEVHRQVAESTGDAQSMVRLCSYQDDVEGRCSYCHEPRAERWGYYCAKHLTPERRNP